MAHKIQKRFGLRSAHLVRKKRRNKILVRVLTGFFTVALVVFFLSWLSFRQIFTVSDIISTGNAAISSDEIAAVAKTELSGSYLHLFSKANIFLYPKRKIEDDLLSSFKRFEQVSGGLEDLSVMHIKVVERQAVALWCTSVGDADCYFIDETGFVFAAATGTLDNLLRFEGLISESKPVGKNYLPSADFNKLNVFAKAFINLGAPIVDISANEEEGDFEAYVRNGGKILFNAKDFSKTLENANAILSESTINDKDFWERLNYLDLRFDNKVFYKLK